VLARRRHADRHRRRLRAPGHPLLARSATGVALSDVWLITDIPGAGKTTAGRLLADRFARSVVIEGDLLQGWIVAGNVWPGQVPADESSRQIELNMRNQRLVARSYAEAGFTAIVDYVIVTRRALDGYRAALAGLDVHLVVLHPGAAIVIAREAEREKSRRHRAVHGRTIGEHFAHLETPLVAELGGVGLWLDTADLSPDATMNRIVAGRDRARLDHGRT
jgi:hypothetical protein